MNARIDVRRQWGALGRMGIVAGMHVAIVFVVAGALVIQKEAPTEDMTAVFIDDPPTIIEPVPPTTPPLDPVKIYVPEPMVPPIEQESETPPETIVAQTLPPGGVIDREGGSPDPVPVIQVVRQDPRRPLSQPAYPPGDIRDGNEGSADLEVYVLPNGRVGDARIARSSGYASLDQSALDEAKRNWRLLPATRDGVAIPQWHRLRVVFKLTKR
jgi:protein TonB